MEINPAQAEDRGHTRRQSFLLYPGESSEVDYKEGVLLKANDAFTTKLAKHILGMCNAGGGFIVIGYIEDEHKKPVPGTMDEAIAASYDLSSLAQIVEKYTEGSDKIELLVHKDLNPNNNITYPVIEVFGFKKRPVFCRSKIPGVLEEGALYIRVASARTIKVASPDEWEQLIDLCIERRREEMLQRFSALMSEIGLANANKDGDRTLALSKEKWITDNKAIVKAKYDLENWPFEGLEFSHWLTVQNQSWGLKQLLDASEEAVRRNTGWPIGLIIHRPGSGPVPKSDKIESLFFEKSKRVDYWAVNTNGDYYYFRGFEEDHLYGDAATAIADRNTYFVSRIWRIAEIIDHMIALYKALGVDPGSNVHLNINHLGIFGRKLVSDNGNYPLLWPRTSNTDEGQWKKEASLDYFTANRINIIVAICKDFFALFDFFDPSTETIIKIIHDYDVSR